MAWFEDPTVMMAIVLVVVVVVAVSVVIYIMRKYGVAKKPASPKQKTLCVKPVGGRTLLFFRDGTEPRADNK